MRRYEIPGLILASSVLMSYVIDLSVLQGLVVCAFVMLSYVTGRRIRN